MKSEDLTPLLIPDGRPEISYHQGTILTWSSTANTVQVAGAVLTDVPVLNGPESIGLAAGDVVLIQRWRSTYFILGRVTAPGATDFASGATQMLTLDSSTATNFGIGTSEAAGAKLTKTITVPTWANGASIMFTTDAAFTNSSGATGLHSARTKVSYGAGPTTINSGTAFAHLATASSTHLNSSISEVISNPGPTITVSAVVWSGNTSGATASNVVNLSGFAIFRNTA